MTTINSTGPSDLARAHDVMDMERWPVACVLMWIRSVRRGWSMPEIRDHLRRALEIGEGAFPVRDYAWEEVKALVDVAAAKEAQLSLFHDHGMVETWQLGPDSRILPTKDASGRYTFGLFPQPPVDIFLGLWCHRRQVQAAWPHSSNAAGRPFREFPGDLRAPPDVAVRRRRGPKGAYPWAAVRVDVMKKLDDEGAPNPDSAMSDWRCQADLERFISDWMVQRLSADAKQPGSSTVRGYASRWLHEHAELRANTQGQ